MNPVNPPDLNRLRDQIQENQRRGTPRPAAREGKVFVNPDGRIVRGADVRDDEVVALSEVPQTTFAASDPRLMRDAEVVARKLPADAQLLHVDGASGWLYPVQSELGDSYELFVYFSGAGYEVKVVSPHVEGQYSPERGHLFSDGRLCLDPSHSFADLESAYAKSVLWATGFSVFLRTGRFPFNF